MATDSNQGAGPSLVFLCLRHPDLGCPTLPRLSVGWAPRTMVSGTWLKRGPAFKRGSRLGSWCQSSRVRRGGDSATSASAFAGITGARWWTNEYGIEVRGSHPSAQDAEEWGSLSRGESKVGQPPLLLPRAGFVPHPALALRWLSTAQLRTSLEWTHDPFFDGGFAGLAGSERA
jgi:hypothetical protein